MNAKHLGDSYDLVKQALLRALAPLGHWATHPMLTAPFEDADRRDFTTLLGTELLSLEVLDPTTDRRTYFSGVAQSTHHVFLDPDTGISLGRRSGTKAPAYVFGEELVAIAKRGKGRLTLVYDQSHARGKEEESLRKKLGWLCERGLFGLAYSSHACFVVVARERETLLRAHTALLTKGRIPERRLVQLP